MNNSIKLFFLSGSVMLFSSCCTNISDEKSVVSNSGNVLHSPTNLAINKSLVTVKVDEIFKNEKGGFIVKALITHVIEDPSYQSLAMQGKTYNLIPNFQLDENKKIIADSEKNENFISLTKLKAGDEFKAVIFFENMNGWFIQEVLPK